MCGRFGLWADPGQIENHFKVQLPQSLPFRYNIAPSQEIPAIRVSKEGKRKLTMLRWGLIPFWAKEQSSKYKMINARADTVFSKPAYKAAVRRRRCLVPATGFFEWKRGERSKQPYLVRGRDSDLFSMAGIWEHWENSETGDVIESCAILTTRPNSVVGELHDRMPVIIKPESYPTWLDPNIQSQEQLTPLMEPYPNEKTVIQPINREVNNPANDNPSVIQPAK
jgi:putative SOS response-associated peptidase YedK